MGQCRLTFWTVECQDSEWGWTCMTTCATEVANGPCSASLDLRHTADGRRSEGRQRFYRSCCPQRCQRRLCPGRVAFRACTQGESRSGAHRAERNGAAFSAAEAGVHTAARNAQAKNY